MEKKEQNIALIFAGGVGNRMHNGTMPKQFLELDGKAIIIYTLEKFENCPEITDIVVVCVSGWEDYLKKLIRKDEISKVRTVVSGGKNPQESQFKGLEAIRKEISPQDNAIVLIHDGVRPLVDDKTILKNIESVKKYGSAITVTPAIETIISEDDNQHISKVAKRSDYSMGKAPQSYYFNEVIVAYEKAFTDGKTEYVDSASLMYDQGKTLTTVEGSTNNIKITTPVDYYVFKGIKEAQRQENIFGI
ncbi:IspD/TarI family cytidylyltransferase [Limosilactobacillus fermentum]|uniref:IspD/TarI family cytidylyltransferase n=1 Tax=Limosilactobacillus fermentum TaxID=1613 RepID=UPI002F2606DB